MKKTLKTIAALALALSVTACSSGEPETADTGDAPEVLKIVATANPHAEILEFAKPILLEEYNVELDIIITDNYYVPNKSVNDGDADANYFQHIPFFDGEKSENGYAIANAGGVHIEPFGIYSKDYTDPADVPDGAEVIISNSVADNGRVLAILASAGLVNLPADADVLSITIADIDNADNNPKGLKFTEVNPELLTTVFENGEGDLVAINGNYAIQAGLNPVNDSLILEVADENNPYVNIVACREGEENDPRIQALIDVLQGDAVRNFIRENWSDGSVIPAE
ncbi:MAG: methionine ABC transporter substrate-binding protein [Solobacterium sp.]|nr:methionine ABC transporter substrate-binding protein [Solobacterium sp.]